MILKLVLVIAISVFGLWLLRARKTARVKAWQKLIIVIFVSGILLLLSPSGGKSRISSPVLVFSKFS
jgi:hypothetical protein